METYKRHFKAAHGDSHLCALCDNQSFVDTETFQTHCNVEHPPMTHRCDMCPEGFDNAYTFALHITTAHTRVQCDLCGQMYMQHERQHHLFKSAVHPKCSICRVGFETKDGLLNHMSTLHPELKCTVCNDIFSTPSMLQQHYNPLSNQPRCELGRAKLEDSKVISQHPQDIQEAVPVEKLDLERADEQSVLSSRSATSQRSLSSTSILVVPPGVFGPDAIQYSTSALVAESSSPSEAWTHGSEVSPRLALTPMSEVSMLFSETPGQSPAPPLHTPLPPRPAPVGCFYPDYPAPLRPSPPEPLAVKTSKNEDGALTPIDAALVRERDILAGEVISILSDELETSEPVFTPQEATPIIGSPPRPASPQITRNRESGSTSQTLAKVPLTSDCFSSPVAVTNPDMISPLTESFSSSTSLLRSPSPIVEPIEQDSFRMPVLEASPAPEGFPGAIPGMFRILPPIDHQLATERVPSPTLRPRFREMGSEAKSKNSCVSQSWAPMFLASPCSEALELDNNTDVRLPNREYLSEQPLQSSVSHVSERKTQDDARWHCRSCKADPCRDPVVTMCGHIFCKSCIVGALIADGSFECAVCKRPILLRLDVTTH